MKCLQVITYKRGDDIKFWKLQECVLWSNPVCLLARLA